MKIFYLIFPIVSGDEFSQSFSNSSLNDTIDDYYFLDDYYSSDVGRIAGGSQVEPFTYTLAAIVRSRVRE